jgi:UDP-3-O-[3-hydroxymyristoyl] N-acetylglucosamine deacetylase
MSVFLRPYPLLLSRAAKAVGYGSGRMQTMAGHRGLQSTLRRRAKVSGIGVHSGREVSVTLHPAEADTGVTFFRTNAEDGRDREIPANFRHVNATDLCTTVGVPGASVATIEHLMATLSALDVDNATIEIDGPEVPVMDGSAGAFMTAVDEAGVAGLDAPLRYLKVLKPIRVQHGEAFAELTPYNGRRIEVEIDFASPLIGRQQYSADIDSESFRRDIARARTFGFLAEVEQLWARGFALGASLENAVVIGDDRVINPEGLRFADEFVRHKVLDAVGDLALAGAPILGRYRSYRGGHRLNFKALEALFADTSAWVMVEAPVRRDVGRAELPLGAAIPVYSAEAS